jgi:carboxylesterase
MKYLHENAKPFYFKGNNIGCLLIHGFTGSAAEMRLLGDYLASKGYTVKGVLLKGHGTSVEDMEKTNWKDWLSTAETELIQLKNKCDKVIVIGLSMGGIIALNLASRFNVDGTVSIAAPIYITNRIAYFAFLLKYFKKYESKRKKEIDEAIKDYLISYDKTPVSSVPHLLRLIRKTRRRLKKVKSPLLIIQSKNDNTVKYESAEYIFNHAGSRIKKLLYLKESGHIVTVDCERERVFKEIVDFIKQIN